MVSTAALSGHVDLLSLACGRVADHGGDMGHSETTAVTSMDMSWSLWTAAGADPQAQPPGDVRWADHWNRERLPWAHGFSPWSGAPGIQAGTV